MMKALQRIFFFSLIGVFVLGQFGRFEFGNGVALYAQDVLLSLIAGVFLLRSGKFFLKSLSSSSLFWFIALFDMWIVFTSLLHFMGNPVQLAVAVLYLLRFNVILFSGTVFYSFLQDKVVSRGEYLKGIKIIPVGIALLGLVQYVLYPDTRGLKLLGWDDHYYRLISTIFDPGFTGIILVVGCLLFLFSILSSSSRFFSIRNRNIFAFILCFGTLLLTYSRASYLAFAAGVFVLTLITRRVWILSFILLLGVAIFFLPRPGGEGVKLERTASITARVESVRGVTNNLTTMDMLMGKGWYARRQSAPTSQVDGITVPNHSVAPENSFVFIFTALGVVGCILWIALVTGIVVTLRFDPLTLSALSAVGVHALFSNTLFHPFILLLLALLLAYRGYVTREKINN